MNNLITGSHSDEAQLRVIHVESEELFTLGKIFHKTQ